MSHHAIPAPLATNQCCRQRHRNQPTLHGVCLSTENSRPENQWNDNREIKRFG